MSHASNFTAGHESRRRRIGTDRLDYPDDHVEADNRLAWMLGPLGDRFDDRDTRYVHLLRDVQDTAESFVRRWRYDPPAPEDRNPTERHPRGQIIEAFAYGILQQPRPWPVQQRIEVCRFYIEVVNANIRAFLRSRDHSIIHLEDPVEDFANLWDAIDARGDKVKALDEWQIRHNASA